MILTLCRCGLIIFICFNLLVGITLMVNLLIYGVIRFLLVALLRYVSFLISEGLLLDREEISAYECGFEHVSYSRLPFSFRYFFLTLIFLIFDIEVVFLLFLPSSLFYSLGSFITFIGSSLFILVLATSLIYE